MTGSNAGTPLTGVSPSNTQQNGDNSATVMTPPPISAWNGALRLGLEIASLVGIGHLGYTLGPVGWSQPVLATLFPIGAATMWGLFNVPNDPSRGGGAPIPVDGTTRLAVELTVLGVGGYALGVWNPVVGGVYGGLGCLHYITYWERIQWLLAQKRN